jgi:hypothetical protein
MTDFRPATSPTFHFISALLEAANREEPEPGDLVQVELALHSELPGLMLRADADGRHVRHAHGDAVYQDDTFIYVEDRPSIQALWEDALRGAPEGVARQDGIASDLRKRLHEGLEQLMTGTPDYHPGSGTIVRDLVHPSLYPLVRTYHAGQVDPVHDVWGRPFERSKFQWIPSTFQVADDGSVQITDSINNLDRESHGALYLPLAELFETMLPLFESVYGYCDGLRFYNEDLEGEHELPEARPGAVPPTPAAPKRLRGRRLQVITKIIEYRLQDAESFEGVWHVEGMSHENILATGVYTLHRDANLDGGDLRFKRAYTLDEAGMLFWNMAQCRPRTVETLVGEGHVPVGSIQTDHDRLFVFPNCHVHKLSKMSVTGSKGVATRRVIVFWLVHPDHPIPSMADVAVPQSTMNHAEALAVRLALMEERRLHKQSHNVRAVSLCEH